MSQSFILVRFIFFLEEELSKLNPKLEAGTYLLAPSNNNLSCFKSDILALFLASFISSHINASDCINDNLGPLECGFYP